jgi:hypothetical protein
MSPPKRCRINPVGFSAFLQAAVFSPACRFGSGKYCMTMKKRLRYRQAPIDPFRPTISQHMRIIAPATPVEQALPVPRRVISAFSAGVQESLACAWEL